MEGSEPAEEVKAETTIAQVNAQLGGSLTVEDLQKIPDAHRKAAETMLTTGGIPEQAANNENSEGTTTTVRTRRRGKATPKGTGGVLSKTKDKKNTTDIKPAIVED